MIRPLRDMLVLRPLDDPSKVGNLFMPDSGWLGSAGSGKCVVLAAGPKCVLAKKDDVVVVKSYDGQHANETIWEHNKEKLVLIRERDIIGVLL